MVLSTTNNMLDKIFGCEKSIEIIAKAGFDAVDLSLCSMGEKNNIFCSNDYLDYAAKLLKLAKKYGVYFNQAHAFFGTSSSTPSINELAYNNVVRGIEIAGVIGAKVIIVHPNQHLPYNEGNNAEILKQKNYEFYKSLLPIAEKNNVTIAIENMWQYNKGTKDIIDSTCSRGPEFCEYVDMIESPYITACLDLGHCPLVGQKTENMIRTLGHYRLGALHVHDNDGISDLHVEPRSPYGNCIDWEEVCKALAEIDYKGDFTFEAQKIFVNTNEETVGAVAKNLHDIGRQLIGRIEYYKAELKL